MYRAKVYITDSTKASKRAKLPREFVSASDHPKDLLQEMATYAAKLKPGSAAKVCRIVIELEGDAEAVDPFEGIDKKK